MRSPGLALRSVILLAAAVGSTRPVRAYSLPTETLSFGQLRPASAGEILDRRDRPVGYLAGDKLRLYRPLSEIDSHLALFVVQAEDAKFWAHNGFDIEEIKHSISKNLEEGAYRRGASTITQQLVKNMFLDKEKSIKRKLYEIPWVMRMEKDLSKKQILELYLNVIEWGPGIYGAEAAARHFFDRPAKSLTMGQALYLALIVPNPKRFDLWASPGRAAFLESKRRALATRLVAEKKMPLDSKAELLGNPFGLSPLSREERNFPLHHIGNYLGNIEGSPAKEWWPGLRATLAGLGAKAKGKSTLRLTLDRDLQWALHRWAEVPAEEPDEAPGGFYVIRQGGLIRAFRPLSKGKVFEEDPASLEPLLPETDPDRTLVGEVIPKMPWKELAP
jgi:membrane peptidoglycan carboxypeptidase